MCILLFKVWSHCLKGKVMIMEERLKRSSSTVSYKTVSCMLLLLTSKSGGGNPTSRPWLVRLWGMFGALIITLGFIALIVYLEKKLPNGSKSQFHPPSWKRDEVTRERLVARAGLVAREPSLGPQILSFVGMGPLIPGRSIPLNRE